jgi:hypothetical protein
MFQFLIEEVRYCIEAKGWEKQRRQGAAAHAMGARAGGITPDSKKVMRQQSRAGQGVDPLAQRQKKKDTFKKAGISSGVHPSRATTPGMGGTTLSPERTARRTEINKKGNERAIAKGNAAKAAAQARKKGRRSSTRPGARHSGPPASRMSRMAKFEGTIEEVRYCIEGDPVMVTDPKTGKKVEFKGKVKKVSAGPDVPHRFLRHGGKQSDQQAVSAGGRRRRKADVAEEVELIRGVFEGSGTRFRKARKYSALRAMTGHGSELSGGGDRAVTKQDRSTKRAARYQAQAKQGEDLLKTKERDQASRARTKTLSRNARVSRGGKANLPPDIVKRHRRGDLAISQGHSKKHIAQMRGTRFPGSGGSTVRVDKNPKPRKTNR